MKKTSIWYVGQFWLQQSQSNTFYCVLYLTDPLGDFTPKKVHYPTLEGQPRAIATYLAQKPSRFMLYRYLGPQKAIREFLPFKVPGLYVV